MPNHILTNIYKPNPHNPSYTPVNSVNPYRFQQAPETCVCGGPTSTTAWSLTLVTLPSIPWKVHLTPAGTEILEMLRTLSVSLAYTYHIKMGIW